MIQYKKGDLLKAFAEKEFAICAIQENSLVGQGAGISKLLLNKYPEIKKYNLEQLRIAKFAPEAVLGQAVPYILKNQSVIYGIYSQYYPGQPFGNGFDTFTQRIHWLKKGLEWINNFNKGKDILLPLIASGLAASQSRKGDLSDLEYFKKYIEPIVEECLIDMNVTVYYL